MDQKPPDDPRSDPPAHGRGPDHEPPELSEASAGSAVGGFGIPERIDTYRLLHSIASGGMGDVFLAVDERSGEQVALKVIRPIFSTPSGAARFRREVELHAKLDHPSIVPYLTAGRWHGPLGELQYLVTRFIDGVDLLTYAAREELGERERLGLIIAVCSAMEHAHGRGVVHRDLKPENILVDRSGVPHILDFGLAATIGSAARDVSRITNDGELIGTVRYMSPESLSDHRNTPGQTADIYTIGVLLFELLTGRVPYDVPDRPTFVSYFRAITGEEPHRLSEVLETPESKGHPLDPVLARCLVREPPERYQSCAALAADLERYLRGERPTATPPPPRTRGALAPPPVKTHRRRRVALGLGAAALLLAVGLFDLIPRIHANRVRDRAMTVLSRAQKSLHGEAHTDSSLERTVRELSTLTYELRPLVGMRFFGHLRRFAYWRLGEAYYFLAQAHDDVDALNHCRISWEQASNSPFDIEIANFVPLDAAFRTSIVEDPQHAVISGVAAAHTTMAAFQSPVTNLSASIDWVRRALDLATGPFRPDHTLGADSLYCLHHRGLAQHNYGAALTRLGVALDSLELIQDGLASLRNAGQNAAYYRFREAYAAYFADRGVTYMRIAELSRNPAPIDSALRCFEEAIAYQDQGLGVGAPKTRLSIAETHMIAARLSRGTGRARHTDAALELIQGSRSEVRTGRPLVRLQHALLEAELWLDRAEDLSAGQRAANRPTTRAATSLAAAESALVRADSAVIAIPYPVPAARVSLLRARLAALAYRSGGDESSMRQARSEISRCRQLIGNDDWPSFHRKLRSVEAMLEQEGGTSRPLTPR